MLIFADALARSWKQVTKFKPAGADGAAPVGASTLATNWSHANAKGDGSSAEEHVTGGSRAGETALEAAGFVRDERGLRFVKESED